ncbi:MAG: DNA polymerase IV [Candidatus Omnitrophota bacterium]
MKTSSERYIVHADMDAFFASVEERDEPRYHGKPIIVGSDPKDGKGRGVVAACSYAARKFGIHSAMPISIAYNKCPDAVFLKPDMEKYAHASHGILKIFECFTPDIEPISIDEAFLDITGSWHLFGTPEKTCKLIKKTVKEKTGLTVSLGMASTKTAAKIASDIGKPDGFVYIPREKTLDFLHPLDVRKLWGVGEKTAGILTKMNIRTIGDLAAYPCEKLRETFGESGMHIKDLASGIDPRPVSPPGEALSVSNEHTFPEDTSDINSIMDSLMHLAEKVSRRLRQHQVKGRTISLKIRFSDFTTNTRSITSFPPTDLEDEIYGKILRLFDEFLKNKKAVRLIGVKASNLVRSGEINDLFEDLSSKGEKRRNIQNALDLILDKYGEGSIRRRR